VWLPVLLVSRESSKPERVYPVIKGLATGNPPYKVAQEDALKIALKAPGCDSVRGMLERLYHHTRIRSRYMAVPDFTPDQALEGDEMFFPEDGSFQVAVEDRLRKFRERAVPLVADVCRRAMEDAGLAPEQISKLVVVSSTGFIGPGLDCELIKALKLNRDMDRSLIGFMGCAAAMNGFRICNDYVRAKPGKYALLCCVELSSVHTTFDDSANDAVLHAIFADGCAAAVLGGETPKQMKKGTLAIVDDYAWLMEDTENGIVLSVNANGISCTLARELPKYIKVGIAGYIDKFLQRNGHSRDEVDFWGVHPGGVRIIEEVQNGYGLTPDQTADSWAVLREYGNMLSPSIMFVLQRIFKRHEAELAKGEDGYKLGLAFSFSPGVGVEGIMLKRMA
jgi:alpha-pyrone synthase